MQAVLPNSVQSGAVERRRLLLRGGASTRERVDHLPPRNTIAESLRLGEINDVRIGESPPPVPALGIRFLAKEERERRYEMARGQTERVRDGNGLEGVLYGGFSVVSLFSCPFPESLL